MFRSSCALFISFLLVFQCFVSLGNSQTGDWSDRASDADAKYALDDLATNEHTRRRQEFKNIVGETVKEWSKRSRESIETRSKGEKLGDFAAEVGETVLIIGVVEAIIYAMTPDYKLNNSEVTAGNEWRWVYEKADRTGKFLKILNNTEINMAAAGSHALTPPVIKQASKAIQPGLKYVTELMAEKESAAAMQRMFLGAASLGTFLVMFEAVRQLMTQVCSLMEEDEQSMCHNLWSTYFQAVSPVIPDSNKAQRVLQKMAWYTLALLWDSEARNNWLYNTVRLRLRNGDFQSLLFTLWGGQRIVYAINGGERALFLRLAEKSFLEGKKFVGRIPRRYTYTGFAIGLLIHFAIPQKIKDEITIMELNDAYVGCLHDLESNEKKLRQLMAPLKQRTGYRDYWLKEYKAYTSVPGVMESIDSAAASPLIDLLRERRKDRECVVSNLQWILIRFFSWREAFTRQRDRAVQLLSLLDPAHEWHDDFIEDLKIQKETTIARLEKERNDLIGKVRDEYRYLNLPEQWEAEDWYDPDRLKDIMIADKKEALNRLNWIENRFDLYLDRLDSVYWNEASLFRELKRESVMEFVSYFVAQESNAVKLRNLMHHFVGGLQLLKTPEAARPGVMTMYFSDNSAFHKPGVDAPLMNTTLRAIQDYTLQVFRENLEFGPSIGLSDGCLDEVNSKEDQKEGARCWKQQQDAMNYAHLIPDSWRITAKEYDPSVEFREDGSIVMRFDAGLNSTELNVREKSNSLAPLKPKAAVPPMPSIQVSSAFIQLRGPVQDVMHIEVISDNGRFFLVEDFRQKMRIPPNAKGHLRIIMKMKDGREMETRTYVSD